MTRSSTARARSWRGCPATTWQKFANLRAYYGFMWGHPGKKLLFMGQEFGQGAEWNYQQGLDWHLLDVGWHKGVQLLVKDLNRAYRDAAGPASARLRRQRLRLGRGQGCEKSVFAWLRQRRGGGAGRWW